MPTHLSQGQMEVFVQHLVVKNRDGDRVNLERQVYYACGAVDSKVAKRAYRYAMDAELVAEDVARSARAIWEVFDSFAPGSIWFGPGKPIHLINDDGMILKPYPDEPDLSEFRLRSFYFYLPDEQPTHNEWGEICP